MKLLSIVDAYALAALGHAQKQQLEGDIVEGWVPELPGVIASGLNTHECMADLFVRVEAFVKIAAESGQPLPVLDGIDLNTPENHCLVEYHDIVTAESISEIYQCPRELDAAFRARSVGG